MLKNIEALTLLSVGTALSLWILQAWGCRRRQKLPPGPPKLPLIGNLLHVPTTRQWETFVKWGQTYDSDILHIEGFGFSFVVLNSYKSAIDLMESRSAIYSSRPHIPLVHDLTGFDYLFALLPYGKRWGNGRKMLTRHLKFTTSKGNQQLESHHLRNFLVRLLKSPGEFENHIRELSTASSLMSIYGINAPSDNDSYNRALNCVGEHFTKGVSIGGLLSTSLPALKPIFSPFLDLGPQKEVTELRESLVMIKDIPFKESQVTWKTGAYCASFVSNALDNSLASPMTQEEMDLLNETASQSFLASSLTSSAVLMSFFLAMVLHPNVQRTAQQELDAVLGGRLPDPLDLKSLPYITAIFREVLRLRPTVPLGVPHLVIREDVYREFYIPENSIVIGNQWAMLLDEETYLEPEEFRPERYLNNGELDPIILDPAEIVFGFGRRACPGRHLAESVIQLTIASVLSVFNISKAINADGCEISPDVPYCEFPHFNPSTFPCRLEPRSLTAAESLREGRHLN